jgi:ribosomal protein S13
MIQLAEEFDEKDTIAIAGAAYRTARRRSKLSVSGQRCRDASRLPDSPPRLLISL